MLRVDHPRKLASEVGRELLVSDWFEVTQERVNQFAQAINDFQWIHVDVERARRESPFGTTIAHGFLTLSLLTPLFEMCIAFDDPGMGINYGFNRVRFSAPLPVGSRIRGRFTLTSFDDFGAGVTLMWHVIVEREGQAKPCIVAEWLTQRYDKLGLTGG